MDKLQINKMQFYGYHGVLKEEQRLGQRFIIDLTIELDLKIAGQTDELHHSVNYAELYTCCQEIVEGQPLKLIETVAEKITAKILNKYKQIKCCTVKVIKPDPPIQGHYDSVAVEITRMQVSQ